MNEQRGIDSSTTDHPDQDPLDNSVLHVGNTAGVASVISTEQERLGMKSDVIVFNQNPYGFDVDEVIDVRSNVAKAPESANDLLEIINKIVEVQKRISDYDVIHFHYRSAISVPFPLLPHGMDLPVWNVQNITVVMHFHGSDIRWKGVPWFYRKFSDSVLVSTPDLLDWAPNTATWVPRPIDTTSIDPDYPEPNSSKPITIVHAPTDRETKGTEHILDAVSTLKSRQYNIDLEVVENTPHSEAIETYKKADIVVDWINPDYGLYGMFSIEAMALGKPVIASLGQTVRKHLPKDNPIIHTNPDTLTERIKILIDNKDKLRSYGEQSREYVEDVHDIRSVIDKYNRIYQKSEPQ